MAYEPTFMTQFQQFCQERKAVRTKDDWLRLSKNWFDETQWPEKSSSQRAAESSRKKSPVAMGGRTWSYMSFAYDLTPEARYEYMATLRKVVDPILFPHSFTSAKTAADGWWQECPYCEITTDEIGEVACPSCGRELLYVLRAD